MKKLPLPPLNLITLDKETQEILDRQGTYKKSKFVRESILEFANLHGFTLPESCPNYMPVHKWKQIQENGKKNRSKNYSYVIAYYWLKSLPKFSFWLKSEIIREAIKFYFNINGIPVECQPNHSTK